MTVKTLYLDIETSPNIGYTWGKWDQNVIEFIEEWRLLGMCYMWEHETKVRDVYPKNVTKYDYRDDYDIVHRAWKLLDEAEVVIAHNGDKFDLKKLNARFVQHNMGAPSPYLTIDTLKVARSNFYFNANNLDALADHLGLGNKIKHEGFAMWLGCMSGDRKSWAKMKKYNRQDVVLLRDVYLRLRPFMKNHPNMLTEECQDIACPVCGSEKFQKRGVKRTKAGLEYQQYQCSNGHYFRSRKRSSVSGLVVT